MSTLKGIVHPVVGPIVPVVLRQSELAEETTSFEAHGYAIVDTGADLTGIDEDLAIRLKLPPAGTLKLTRPGPLPDFTACRFSGEIAFPGTRFPSMIGKLIGYHGLDSWFDEPGVPQVRVIAVLGRDYLRDVALSIHGTRREVVIQRLP